MKIDSHQHFWEFNPIRDAWIDDTMQVIRRDFMPKDLEPILELNGIDGCVAVQADQSETETAFLLDLALQYHFIKGVVGWVDILDKNLDVTLADYSKNPFFKAVRHIAQNESDDFLQRDEVIKGISQLAEFGFGYDILIYAHQLPAAIELVNYLPKQAFVVDHIAKPKISEGLDEEWVSNMQTLATFPNVHCKISGMVTESNNYEWVESDFKKCIDVVVNSFGIERIMYGSDWPVCLIAANYESQLDIVRNYFKGYSIIDQEKVMGGNAIGFYNLDIS